MTVATFLRGAALVAAIQIAAFGIFFYGQIEEIDGTRSDLAIFKQQYVTRTNQAANLDLYKAQLVELDNLMGEAMVELPNKVDAQFAEVRSAVRAHGLRIDLLQPDPAERDSEYYSELSARLDVRGPFHQVAAFVANLAVLPGSALLGPFRIHRSYPAGIVSLSGTVRTFRYVDEAELAGRRKAAAALKQEAK